jgi:uncharacterized protein GlcG (DUF336 family)
MPEQTLLATGSPLPRRRPSQQTTASITLGRNEGSTKEIANWMAKNAPSTIPQTPLPNVTYGVGGVTIKANGAAIGVSGAPGVNFDEECAMSALAKIQDKLK